MSEKRNPLSRREFLIGLGAIAGGLTLAGVQKMLANARLQTISRTYLPFVVRGRPTPTRTPVPPTATATPPPTPTASPTDTATPSPTVGPTTPPPSGSGLVVHVRDAQATSWSGANGTYFYNEVDTAIVEAMLLDALQELTGQSSWGNIWQVLFGRVHSGGYQPGQKIAIKTSFNNSIFNGNSCSSHNNQIDAVPQLALALLNGLHAAGVHAEDVYFYDASGSESGQRYGKTIPNYFRTPLKNAYSQVNFIGLNDCSGVQAPTYGKDPSLTVTFNDPGGQIPDRLLTDILYDATYIINIPIVKAHKPGKPNPSDIAIPASIGMKNHCGSINYVYASAAPHSLHEYMEINGGEYYSSSYNPLVDLNAHPIIKNKTALILADCLYGSTGSSDNAMKTWYIFGNQAANSLLVSTDPVALDCVAVDLLRLELPHQNKSLDDPRVYDFLFCGQEAGLGICEGTRNNPGGDPLQTPYGSGYNDITYVRIDR